MKLLLALFTLISFSFGFAQDEPESVWTGTAYAYGKNGFLLYKNKTDVEVYRINYRKKIEVIYDYDEKGKLANVIECHITEKYQGPGITYERECDNDNTGSMNCLGSACSGYAETPKLSDGGSLIAASVIENKKTIHVTPLLPTTDVHKVKVVRKKLLEE